MTRERPCPIGFGVRNLDIPRRKCIVAGMARKEDPPRRDALRPGGLTRSQVAHQFGVSVTAVHRMRMRGDLHTKRDGDGVWHYDPAEVIRAAAARGSPRQRTPGQLAADAFRMFDEGGELKDIVMAQQITPEEVRRLYREWQSSLDDPPPAPESRGPRLLDEEPGADEAFVRAIALAMEAATAGSSSKSRQ
jgi:hypothetical protein